MMLQQITSAVDKAEPQRKNKQTYFHWHLKNFLIEIVIVEQEIYLLLVGKITTCNV
jgi:hypothetical protein